MNTTFSVEMRFDETMPPVNALATCQRQLVRCSSWRDLHTGRLPATANYFNADSLLNRLTIPDDRSLKARVVTNIYENPKLS